MKRIRIALATSISIFSVGFGLTPLAHAVEWNAYTYAPAATLAGARGLQTITERVAKETNGELKINYHLAGAVPIKTTTITQAVAEGTMQLGDDGLYQGNIPIGGLLQLPMLLVTTEHLEIALKIMMPYIEKAYASKGVQVIGGYYYPLQVSWSRNKLESLADLKGQKMRVTSPEQSAFVRQFGGVPATLGAEEVPSGLDTGVISGVFTASSGGGKIWGDLLKYSYRLGPNFFNAFIIVNKSAYDKLTPDTQVKLKNIVSDVMPWNTKTLFEEEDQVTAALRAKGMKITEATAADMALGAKLMEPYWKTWAEKQGPDAVEALGKIRAAIGR
jgi:TRAP-type C4-dicarboxylate transport system substrate-binding protein